VPYYVSLLAVALVMARPALFPQFTLNAGLLTVAAVLGWRVHARFGDLGSLAAACFLAAFGFLIRREEFFLVFLVASPFLPWRALRERRSLQLAFLLLSIGMILAASFDRWSYSGQQWQQFSELNSARAFYTDFGAAELLKKRPEIISRHGYSRNDIDLIGNWFFVDGQLADPTRLQALRAELWPTLQRDGTESGFAAIRTLMSLVLLPLIVPAVLLVALTPRWPLLLAWTFCLAAIFAMGFVGRPGVLRVYLPALSVLLIAPLLGRALDSRTKYGLVTLALAVAVAGSACLLLPEALASKRATEQINKDAGTLPSGPIIIWGDGFPLEAAFPVLARRSALREMRLYPLGVFTHAPFSVAQAEQHAGRGLIELLRTDKWLSIAARERHIDLLRDYCREHLGGDLHEMVEHEASAIAVRQVRCERRD
jgi:hypothetical protein